jgi:hypothetical protein
MYVHIYNYVYVCTKSHLYSGYTNKHHIEGRERERERGSGREKHRQSDIDTERKRELDAMQLTIALHQLHFLDATRVFRSLTRRPVIHAWHMPATHGRVSRAVLMGLVVQPNCVARPPKCELGSANLGFHPA